MIKMTYTFSIPLAVMMIFFTTVFAVGTGYSGIPCFSVNALQSKNSTTTAQSQSRCCCEGAKDCACNLNQDSRERPLHTPVATLSRAENPVFFPESLSHLSSIFADQGRDNIFTINRGPPRERSSPIYLSNLNIIC